VNKDAKSSHRLIAIRYLLLALLLHAGLLLLPAFNEPPPPPDQGLDIVLLRPAVVLNEPLPRAARPEQPAAPTAQPQPGAPGPEATPGETRPPPPGMATGEPVERPPVEPAMPTVARLRDSLSGLVKEPPGAAPQSLGRPTSSAFYQRMRQPLLPLADNRFSPYAAPLETEIVDRWQSPEGVHQVVVKTPNGATLCGRQEAVDDFRPWTQMPMMFHECAGGGKR
jgi:hypothetical protein